MNVRCVARRRSGRTGHAVLRFAASVCGRMLRGVRERMWGGMAPLRAAGCCLMVVMALVLTSCTSPCRMMADVGIGAWHEPAELFIDNEDTLAPCDLLLVVRSNTAFDGDTLTLRIGVLTPDSLRCEESLLLSVPRGGSAAVARETQTVYRRNVVLADSGRYVFTVVPQRTVRGIEAVGLFPVRKRP